jgi:hypothetical protein
MSGRNADIAKTTLLTPSGLVGGDCGLQVIAPKDEVIRPGANIAGALGQINFHFRAAKNQGRD